LIRVGIVGMGFMGWIHWLAYQRLGGARVTAIASRDPRRRQGDWRGIQGNFGPPGETVDLSGIATYASVDELVADARVDLLDITLPPSLHADATIRALEAGKHVLCEKPMALKLDDCSRMVEAASKAKRLLMIGHVLPFFPEYHWAYQTARGGKYGAPLGGTFRRIISDPTWIENFWSPEEIGGPMLDLHVHDAHFIRLMFGLPQEVVASGRSRNGVPEFWHAQFRFANRELAVAATSGTIAQQGRPFTHSFEIHFEKATLAFDFAVLGGNARYLCEPMLLNSKGQVEPAKLPAGGDPIDAFVGELREVVRAIREGQASEILGAVLAQDAIRICEKEAESMRLGLPVKCSS
jgi:predicted dehydrogenase